MIKNPVKPKFSHPLQAQLQGNNSLRVKAFIYDFVAEKVVEAKLQEFGLRAEQNNNVSTNIVARLNDAAAANLLVGYVPIDDMLQTVPVILGWEKPTKTNNKNKRNS